MLDQHAEEALDRSIQRAMHHHRLVPLAVFADIFQSEALRQVEVELHGRKLPQTPNRIHQLHIDLRSVKRRLARDRLVRNAASIQHFLERVVAPSPTVRPLPA